jgi:hypothetical protein
MNNQETKSTTFSPNVQELANQVSNWLQKGYKIFRTFYGATSSVYKSPIQIASSIIQSTVPKEYRQLLDVEAQWWIDWFHAAQLLWSVNLMVKSIVLSEFQMIPGRRLIFQHRDISQFSVSDQDRFIAAESSIPYRTYQQFLNLFSWEPQLLDVLTHFTRLWIVKALEDDGTIKSNLSVQVNWLNDNTESFIKENMPEINIDTGIGLFQMGQGMLLGVPVTNMDIDMRFLSRYDTVSNKNVDAVRKIVLSHFVGMPLIKRRFWWWDKRDPEVKDLSQLAFT